MDTILFLTLFLLAALLLICFYAYKRSGFALLEVVKADQKLWEQLGKPEKEWVECVGDSGGYYAIRPSRPWFRWLLSGNPDRLQPDIARKWKITSILLKSMFLMITAALLTAGWLVISSLP